MENAQDDVYYKALIEKAGMGVLPVLSNTQRIIHLCRLETPLGTMFACATDEGICLLEFADRKMLTTAFKTLSRQLNALIVPSKNLHLNNLKMQLDEYFEGKRKVFTLPLFTPGTTFQNEVWNCLKTIPYGETRSYLQQAKAINNSAAVRAVANANGMNRICIIIPCHRVVGSNGSLTGFTGGLWRKRWLLDLESSAIKPMLF
jgi:AraC family transcriptional regulator of adaptative response/methylated-DNA-[protein]-cysteine methyltransferase